ncbi:hypothetical protein Rsub_00221 [Raphidocelis subcapitata]|uniref:PROP1-like PPR domain-containing protein n=1 Tax=Raphidocelis subcapitata TaxID=307507 RepID=A0A2V0NPT3_9CHLO|nr:hypothetical protein Rsub_00221 [Raphidocelis subcapitata]|eukprot:GBF87510.1 hypothetical protein Rsub_00221 [Raphidocelis subcapitata]
MAQSDGPRQREPADGRVSGAHGDGPADVGRNASPAGAAAPAQAAAGGADAASENSEPCLSLRELRKALEEAPDIAAARALILANSDLGDGGGGGGGGGSGGEAHSIGPRAVCELITQLGRAKQCDKAIAVFEECPALGIEPNSHIFSALVSACSNSSRWEAALQYFRLARSAGAANEITFSAAIAACMRAGDLDRGLELLKEMQEGGMGPDALTFSTVIGAAQRTGSWDEHDRLMSDMHARGFVAPRKIYAVALDRCRLEGDWEGALRVYQGMQAAAAAGDGGAAERAAQGSSAPAERAPAAASSLAAHEDPSLLLLVLRTLLKEQRNPLALDLLRDHAGVMDGRTCSRAAELLIAAGLEPDAVRLRRRAAELHRGRRGRSGRARGGRASSGSDSPARARRRSRPPAGGRRGGAPAPAPAPGLELEPPALRGGPSDDGAAAILLQSCSPAGSPCHSSGSAGSARSNSDASSGGAAAGGRAPAARACGPQAATYRGRSPLAWPSSSAPVRSPQWRDLPPPPPPLPPPSPLPPGHGEEPPAQAAAARAAPPTPSPAAAPAAQRGRGAPRSPPRQLLERAHSFPPSPALGPGWHGQGQWPVPPPWQMQVSAPVGPYMQWARPMPMACMGAWMPQQYMTSGWVWSAAYAPYPPARPPPPPRPPADEE